MKNTKGATVKQLRAKAKAAGVRGYSRMSKAELEQVTRRTARNAGVIVLLSFI